MSEKWFVVSEQELNYLTNTASDYETGDCSSASLEYAKAACRARPFEKYQAVVEAAQLLAGDGVVDDGMYIVESRFRSRMKQALAALEEEVCVTTL